MHRLTMTRRLYIIDFVKRKLLCASCVDPMDIEIEVELQAAYTSSLELILLFLFLVLL